MTDVIATLAHPAVFPWVAVVLGLIVGSFLNVVIHRLPKMMEHDWEAQCAELAQSKGAEAGMQGAAAASAGAQS
jgi:leader peptidase (prepilin peptidase) / N-methyltransferase